MTPLPAAIARGVSHEIILAMAIEIQQVLWGILPLPIWHRVKPQTAGSSWLLFPHDFFQMVSVTDPDTVEVTKAESIVTGPEGLRLIPTESQTYYRQQITEMFHRRHPRLRWRPTNHHNP